MRPVALLCSDFHASLSPPVIRSAETDWIEAMRRPLRQIRELQKELSKGRDWNIPVLFAGDLFDRWNSSAELTNFLLEEIPDDFWTIPGQHDLPHHSYEDVKRSSYWTLVAAGKIDNVPNETVRVSDELLVLGFPWGFEPRGWDHHCEPGDEGLVVALIHRYCWTERTKHPNASESGSCPVIQEQMKGFDLIVSGDNHKPFFQRGSGDRPSVFNCGTLMRRKADEIDHRPSIGVLMSDGKVERRFLDCSEDKFLEQETTNKLLGAKIDLADFVDGLTGLEAEETDFVDVVNRFLDGNRLDPDVKRTILEVVEHAKGK